MISLVLSFPHRMFVAQQIASSNLLLLVTDAACDCSIFPPVLLDAKEVKYILLHALGLWGGWGGKTRGNSHGERGGGHGPACGPARAGRGMELM